MGLINKNSLAFLSQISSIIIILIGFIILVGWILNISILITPGLDYRSTSLLSSVCFIFVGISIILLQKKDITIKRKSIAQILSLIVLLTGLFTLLDYIIYFIVGTSLIGNIVGFQNLKVFRASIIASLAFILTGAAILFIDYNKSSKHNLSQYFMIIVFFMMYLIILGYIYQTEIYQAPNTTQPSFYSAITFILITVSVLCLRPDRGVVELLTSSRLGGTFGYKILLAIIIIPIIVGGLRFLGEIWGFYNLRFGAALMTFAITAILFIITLESVISIDNIDIKRKKAENELKKAHDNLEKEVKQRTLELQTERDILNSILNTTKSGIYIVNSNYELEYINPIMEKDFGLSKGQKCYKYFYNEHDICSNCKIQEAFKGNVIEWEQHSSKSDKTYDTLATPIKVNGSISVIVFLYDVTRREIAEEQLKEIVTELERSNQELQSFAYITSHDLQEPLRTLASYAGLLKRRYEGQLDSDADDFIEYMVSGSQRMNDMIQGLLDYSRVGTKGEEFKEFNAEEALNHALTNLKSSIEECHAQVTHEKLPQIVADESQITRVFQNLIGNALKFRKEGIQPKIHISARKKRE